MVTGLRGRLVTSAFVQDILPTLPGAAPPPPSAARALERWAERVEASCGPASSLRTIADAAVIPLLRILGFDILRRADEDAAIHLHASARDEARPPSRRGVVPVVVLRWGEALHGAWRASVIGGIRTDTRWCLCSNGRALRIIDAQETWSRQYLEFDLPALVENHDAQTVLWSVARADTLAAVPALLDRAAELSVRQGQEICRALGGGVIGSLRLLLEALARRHRGHDAAHGLFDESLTVVYRILFLLFAEARGLVPIWHPLYRDRYTIEAIVTALLAGRRYRGVWNAVKAISHLAHAGCASGELGVTAFNGRLFAPEHAPAFERLRVDDEVMSQVVLGVAVVAAGEGPRRRTARVHYRDLDVEQLGAVYEHVLEYHPGGPGDAARGPGRDERRATGTFYTPRPVTAHLVRRTLEPLVAGRTAAEILDLRVLDPAMGSGAFLVAACRFLARSAEEAFIRDGQWHPGDVAAADRAALRREIAQRCLFGVDLNPVAVQLARLSLWLATLAADRPLTFLDHHLVVGNSLVGATPDDVRRQPSAGPDRRSRAAPLPLFDEQPLEAVLGEASRIRRQLALEPDDTAAVVRDKERRLAGVHDRGGSLGRVSSVLDLWCAGWFGGENVAPDRATFADLADRLLHERSVLPAGSAAPMLQRAADAAARHRFLHWPLAFPEVFGDGPQTARGFDALVGNPPWDMVRGDSGGTDVRTGRRDEARHLSDFVRESGIYRIESRAHLNRYALFLERALQLVRPGGRVGLILPGGVVTDAGMAPLRRHLFERARVDSITGLDNRSGIFPIHRSLRCLLLTCTPGEPTADIAVRFGLSQVEDLDRPPQPRTRRGPLVLTRRFLERISGPDDLGIPEVATTEDLRIVEPIAASTPWLGAQSGWNVRFGRELNATDDRGAFVPFTGDRARRPVLAGKQLDPFRVSVDDSRYELDPAAARLVQIPRRARLAYRDIASATNRLTLIAAIVPPRAVTTHTLFVLKTLLPPASQHVLCALLNSFVANYLIRMRVNIHVTVALVARLPVPLVAPGTHAFERLAVLSEALSAPGTALEAMPEYADSQALAARLYALTTADFAHVLSTFPLVDARVRAEALARFARLL